MPCRCIVLGCSNGPRRGISLHQMPLKDPILFEKWEKFVQLKRKNWKATPSSHICSAHFLSDQFEESQLQARFGYGNKVRILKKTAIPSIIYPKDNVPCAVESLPEEKLVPLYIMTSTTSATSKQETESEKSIAGGSLAERQLIATFNMSSMSSSAVQQKAEKKLSCGKLVSSKRPASLYVEPNCVPPPAKKIRKSNHINKPKFSHLADENTRSIKSKRRTKKARPVHVSNSKPKKVPEMWTCCVPLCNNTSLKQLHLSFHELPKSPSTTQKRVLEKSTYHKWKSWLQIVFCHCGVPSKLISDKVRICSSHFEEEAFSLKPAKGLPGSQVELLDYAVPSIFSQACTKLPGQPLVNKSTSATITPVDAAPSASLPSSTSQTHEEAPSKSEEALRLANGNSVDAKEKTTIDPALSIFSVSSDQDTAKLVPTSTNKNVDGVEHPNLIEKYSNIRIENVNWKEFNPKSDIAVSRCSASREDKTTPLTPILTDEKSNIAENLKLETECLGVRTKSSEDRASFASSNAPTQVNLKNGKIKQRKRFNWNSLLAYRNSSAQLNQKSFQT